MSRRRRTAKSEEERAVNACLKGEDTEGFRLGFIDEFIGSGVFCEKRFKKGDFLLEYQGELISQEEGEHREASYPEDVGSFLYFFCHNGKTKCIDATDSCGNGRMVNDGTNLANCKMRIVTLEGVPKLCLFALKDVEKGSELRCDYGVSDLPWRKREQIQKETKKVPQESSSEQSEEAKDLTHYPENDRDSSEVFQQLSEASSSKTVNKEANIIAGKSKQPPRYKKPSRKCPFCGKYYQEKLTRHIKLVHKDEEQVKRALELPQKERVEAIALMRKEGILHANILQMKVDNPKYEVERRTDTKNPLVICGLCKGFYSTKFFARHKAICQGDSCLQACSVPVSLMTPEFRVNQNISEVERRTATKTPLGFITEEHENENSSHESDITQRRSHAIKGKGKRMLKLPRHKRLKSLRCTTGEHVSGSCESNDRDSSEVFQQLSEASSSKTVNKEANSIAGKSKQPPRFKKPSRKCPFCGKYYKMKLTKHLKLDHKDEGQVKRALDLPQKEMVEAIALMRKEGILHANKLQMNVDNPKYEVERKTATKTPLGLITEDDENEYSSRESDKAQRRFHAKKGKQKTTLKLPRHKRLKSLRCTTRKHVSGSCESDDRDNSEVFQQLSEASSSKTVNKEANSIAGNSKQSPGYKKPSRKCPFCGKYYKEKLTRHIKLVHKDEEQVKRALELPKQEMEETFALMRKEGILHANQLQMNVENPKYKVERKTATKTPLGLITEDDENEYSSRESDKAQRMFHAKKGKQMTTLKLPRHKRLKSLRCTTRKHVSGSRESDDRDSSEVFQQLSEASSSKTVNKEANIIAGNSKQSPGYKKPSRKCPFCGKYYKEKLTRHIKLVHKDEEQVKRALELPKQEMEETFALMKKEGILHANQLQMKVDNPKYETERRTATENPLVICGLCKGFYATRFFGRHKAICQGDSCLQACSVPVSLVTPEFRVNQNISEFQRDILRRFKEDEVGGVCRSDPFIVDIGKRLLDASRNNEDKKTEVRKHVMSDMRRLASLYRCFKEQHEIHGTGPLERGTARDMFQRGNFNCLTEAISSYSGEGNELKPGLKIGLYYLLKKSCKIVKATHLVEGQDACAEEIDQFVATLELNYNYLFGDVTNQGKKNRQANLRNPAALPLEEDVKKLRNYISSVITTMMEDDVIVWDSYNFEKLRDVVVARLTLFNAKHRGEPCRLSIEEWKEAMADAWIDETQADAISDQIEEHMLTKLKVTYQTVRGILVPVLFPDDCIQAIEVLTSSVARSSAGVLASNGYVFPRIQSSPHHVTGWHALSGICHDAEVSSKSRLNATRNRHHISTLYASMDVPASERASYLKHMGYLSEVKENIDQAPPAVMEVVEVGQPQQIDADHDDNLLETRNQAVDDAVQDVSGPGAVEHHEVNECDKGTAKKRKCSEEVKAGTKKTRKYTKWTESDTKLVKNHFHSIITDQTAKTIPNKAEVEGFMKVTKLSSPYPWQTVRTKVMNEREKWKKRFTGRLQAMIESQLL